MLPQQPVLVLCALATHFRIGRVQLCETEIRSLAFSVVQKSARLFPHWCEMLFLVNFHVHATILNAEERKKIILVQFLISYTFESQFSKRWFCLTLPFVFPLRFGQKKNTHFLFVFIIPENFKGMCLLDLLFVFVFFPNRNHGSIFNSNMLRLYFRARSWYYYNWATDNGET